MTSTTGLRETLDWQAVATAAGRIPSERIDGISAAREVAANVIATYLEASLSASMAGPVPEGMVLVPEDLLTHLADWETACHIALQHAGPATVDGDDPSYWRHQLKTIASIRAMLAAAPAPVLPEAKPVASPAEGEAVAFVEENGWPPVATVKMDATGGLEIVRKRAGGYILTVHSQNEEKSYMDDLSVDLTDADLRAIGSLSEGWRTMDSAPLDGTRVILDWGGKARAGYYLDNSKTSHPWQGWKVPSMEEWPSGQPQRWMPFPRLTSESDPVSPDREAATREAVTALDEIREHVVLAIAFLGRDLGTARMETTLPQVIAGLVKADASLRALAQQAKPQQEKI